MTRELREYLANQKVRLQSARDGVDVVMIRSATYERVMLEIEKGARSAKSIAKHTREAMQ